MGNISFSMDIGPPTCAKTKKSVAQYILDLRMEKLAWYLQNTNYPLTRILDLIGMEKNNYFYTRFKKYFGMSLGEYRQQFQNAGGGED